MTDFLRAFLRFDPPVLFRAVLLNFAVALTEGAGLLMLLPILSLAGVLGNAGVQKNWLPQLDHLSAKAGIGLNIGTALFVFVTLIFVQSLLVLLKDRVSNALQLRFTDQLRKALYAAIARARWSFLTGSHSGELLSVLTSDVQRVGIGTFFLLRLFTTLVMVCVYTVVALWLSVPLTLLALVTGIMLWFMLRRTDTQARQSGRMLSDANRNMFGRMQDFLSALKLIKIHGEEAGDMYRFNSEVDQISDRLIKFRQANTSAQAVYRVGGALALAVVSYAALVWFTLPAATLLVMIAIFARMLPQLAELQNGRQQLLHMLPAYEGWKKLMTSCEVNRDPVQSSSPPVLLAQGIAFEQVVFSHPQSHHTLRIDKLVIPARKITALIGVSGSGKTTMLDLLTGLHSPDAGIVVVDGTPLHQLPGWRKSIAYIPQETLIQNGTIRDNLIWGNDAHGPAEIEQALAQSALLQLVKQLPCGLDTEVGERGVKLSGGERQRLALARALLRRPQLLVLDEATSALDADNHRVVLDAIRALDGSMTVLVVTHRHEDLYGLIDGLVRVENGVVGSWEEVACEVPSIFRLPSGGFYVD